VMVEAVEPSPAVWDKIKAELGPAATPHESSAPSAAPSTEAPAAPAAETAEAAPPPSEGPQADAVTEAVTEAASASQPVSEPLADAASDSIAASLAKSLGEAPTSETGPEAPPATEHSAEVIQLRHRVGRWRSLSFTFGAIAALLALYVGLAQFAPGSLPFGGSAARRAAQTAATQLGVQLVAVLQHEPTGPAFLLTVDPQSRTMIVRRVSATPEPGRSYQLWLIAKQFPTPRSLGLVGADEYTERAVPANFDVETLRSARYAVSLEPPGGSPTGVPTGPVLFTGNIVQAVPAAPPPRPASPKT